MKSLVLALGLLVLIGGASPASEPAPVTIVGFNIRYGTAQDGENRWDRRRDRLVETVKSLDPDLLGTQETLAFQRSFLEENLPGYGVFGVGRNDGKESGEMMAVFWRIERFEKIDGGHFWLSETPDKPGSKSWDSSLPRMATWIKLRDRGNEKARPVLFVNTHFDHRGPTARVESAGLLRNRLLVLGKGCSIVVTGDFNAAEQSAPYRALFGDREGTASPVVDTYRVAHPVRRKGEGTSTSFRAKPSNSGRIDWIGCSRDWTVQRAAIDRMGREGRYPSDHFAVVAVLARKVTRGTVPATGVEKNGIRNR